eukprot:4621295-Pleurochrysis_carterae.AAC.2
MALVTKPAHGACDAPVDAAAKGARRHHTRGARAVRAQQDVRERVHGDVEGDAAGLGVEQALVLSIRIGRPAKISVD